MTEPGALAAAGSGQWWVISVPTSGRGSPQGQVAQKPFPIGAVVISGPYPNRAAAEKALAGGPAGNTNPGPLINIPNPFSWVGAVAHWIGDLTLSITDVHMWISLGWLVLGIGLIYFGFLLWLKVPQTAVSVAEGAAARA